MQLTVGVDARAATEEPAGRGRYVRELLRALAGGGSGHRWVLYARTRWEAGLDERFEWRLVRDRDPLWHVRVARAANRSCDVFLSSNSYLTAWFLRIPVVPVVYDLVTFDPAMRPSRRSAVIERLTLGGAVRRAARLLAISEATATALVTRFPAAAGRVVVTPLGVPAELLDGARSGASIPRGVPESGFVLAVGTLEPRKNLPRLVEAFRSLPEELQRAHPLVVTGGVGWETSETIAALRALGDRCRLTGFVPDAELAELYRRCALFCYPSLGEGFGLPVLEAMHAGAVVITSDRSSLPEVGGDSVEYVDPTDVASIASGMERLLRDDGRRRELSRRAAARAAGFRWEHTAALTVKALEAAAADGA